MSHDDTLKQLKDHLNHGFNLVLRFILIVNHYLIIIRLS